MKYPQLVSTRAVNAISDWLVSRLEQLGVEAPLIYSRLLLSLLQSSVQINDPIEFSNLETFLANRKGHNKRYPPCDKDAFKKITAVQCLTEIVSSEQEITKIERLVDELCEKLNDVEEQLTSVEEDGQRLLHATISMRSHSRENNNTIDNSQNQHQHRHHIRTDATGSRLNSTTSSSTSSLSGASSAATTTADIEDPRKRYYKAFPALTKDMDDSMRILKRNEKSLTWPLDKRTTNTSLLANRIERNSFEEVDVKPPSAFKNKVNFATELISERPTTAKEVKNNSTDFPEAALDNPTQSTDIGVKRKTKRRRNHALSKGKSGNTTRKYLYNGKMASPTCWDTDFEGSWEMGRDLIKEFIFKENSRNRSTSESAAYSMDRNQDNKDLHEDHICNEDDEKYSEKRRRPMDIGNNLFEQHSFQNYSKDMESLKAISMENCAEDISFCKEIVAMSPEGGIGGEDTLATVSEITDDSLNITRRLYERDISYDSLNDDSDQQNDFARLKAKFDSSVEALWKNANNSSSGNQNNNNIIEVDPFVSLPSTSSSIAGLSAPAVAVFRENLKNFWSNYYSNYQKALVDTSNIKSDNGGAILMGDASTSDYHSMSSNIDSFNKSVGASIKKSNGGNTPIGVFLQNTIWSENKNSNYSDTDEAFSFKVWNSLKNDSLKVDSAASHNNKDPYYLPYNTSKWSEGINGGPHISSCLDKQNQISFLCQSQNPPSSIGMLESSLSEHRCELPLDCPKEPVTSYVVSSSGWPIATHIDWQKPADHNLQEDVKSWNFSNPMSLPDMYGSNNLTSENQNCYTQTCNTSCSSNNSISTSKPSSSMSSPGSNCSSSMSTNITLTNHSATSGFVEYAQVKSFIKINEPIGSNGKKLQTGAGSIQNSRVNSVSTSSSHPDDENLLTSERTHFHPIKSYADGHSFDISSSLDIIEYDRSKSGYLYFDSEKYLEYTRSDAFLSEEENVLSSNAGLYSLSNNYLPAASNMLSSTIIPDKMHDFVIKFRVRNNEIACQTDLPLSAISTEISLTNSRSEKAKVKVSLTSNNNNNDKKEYNLTHGLLVSGKESSKHKVVDWTNVGSDCRTTLSEYSMSLEQWTMVEIGKKCVDNNNSSHTLWGMCQACNNDMKPIPADRLLKDELNVEADEIMSDLKYMQDLYIGNDWDDDDDNDNDDDAEAGEDFGGDMTQCDDNDDMDLDQSFNSSNCNEASRGSKVDPHHHQDILYTVNKLIADLLRPPQNKGGANKKTLVTTKTCFRSNVNNKALEVPPNKLDNDDIAENRKNNNEKYIGGLWTCDENIIWKKELAPISVIANLKNNSDEIENCFLEKLNWEYSNLAHIWDKESPYKSPDRNFCKPLNIDKNDKYLKQVSNEQNFKNNDYQNSIDECIAESNSKNNNSIASYFEEQQVPKRHSTSDFQSATDNFSNSTPFKISNRIDRKRRHSASQSIISFDAIATNNNNNNNICNKNSINLKLNTHKDDVNSWNSDDLSKCHHHTETMLQLDDVSKQVESVLKECNDHSQRHDGESVRNPHETIITCKYWTTVKPISPAEYENFTDSRTSTSLFIEKGIMSSIALDTSSMLKHVASVSRPLTR